MKLEFLGTGTSCGVPQMRCKCKVCTSTDPHDKRLRCSALLRPDDGSAGILIDCGPDFRQQMLRTGCPDLACTILTHTHYDHVGGVDDLRPYSYAAAWNHFDIYCAPDVANDLRNRVPYCFAEVPYPGVPQFNLREIAPFESFTVDTGKHRYDVLPLAVRHGRLNILGYRIGDFAYITDASEVPAATLDAIKGVDTLVINALRHESHPSHLNLREALGVIELTAPRQAYLTHFSHQIGLHSELKRLLPDNVFPACDRQVIEIPDENRKHNDNKNHAS